MQRIPNRDDFADRFTLSGENMALTGPAPAWQPIVSRPLLTSLFGSTNEHRSLRQGCVSSHHHVHPRKNTLLAGKLVPPLHRIPTEPPQQVNPDNCMYCDVCSRLVRSQIAGRRTLLDPGAILPVGQPLQHLAPPRLASGRGDRYRSGLEELTWLHRCQGAARWRPAEEEPAAGHRHTCTLRPLGWSASVPTGGRPQRRGRCPVQRRQLRDGHLAQRQGDNRGPQPRMEGKALQSQGCAAYAHSAGG